MLYGEKTDAVLCCENRRSESNQRSESGAGAHTAWVSHAEISTAETLRISQCLWGGGGARRGAGGPRPVLLQEVKLLGLETSPAVRTSSAGRHGLGDRLCMLLASSLSKAGRAAGAVSPSSGPGGVQRLGGQSR